MYYIPTYTYNAIHYGNTYTYNRRWQQQVPASLGWGGDNSKYQLHLGQWLIGSSRRQSSFVTYSIRTRRHTFYECIYDPVCLFHFLVVPLIMLIFGFVFLVIGATCQVSAWNHVFLGLLWMYSAISVVILELSNAVGCLGV